MYEFISLLAQNNSADSKAVNFVLLASSKLKPYPDSHIHMT